MSITFQIAPRSAASTAPLLGLPTYAGAEPADPAGGGGEGVAPLDAGWLEQQGFTGAVGETTPVVSDGDGRIIAVGLGPRDEVTPDVVRRAAAAFAKAAWHADEAAFLVPADLPLDAGRLTQAVVEGIGLRAYQFSVYKSSPKPCQLRSVLLLGGDQAGADRGRAVVQAVTLARDLVNEPAGAMPPARLAEEAQAALASSPVEVTVLDEQQIEDEKLGGLLGVSRGSVQPPRLIRMEWSPPGATATVVLVGKGITFDSGGLSLKTGDGMMHMKADMSGAAAVIATLSVLPTLAPDVRVVGIVPATENMPSGQAIKPGDVLRFRNGKTAEILNTDAEGRLVLADGLSLAAELEPTAIIDLATLTGACVVALGREMSGVMGNDDGLVQQVLAASDRAGEDMWRLPLPARYRKLIDSEIADMKNVAASPPGALVAGLFLQEFVGDVPWVHLDIAGPAWTDSEDGYTTQGGTGVGVRTLLELLAHFEPAAAGTTRSGAERR